MWWLFLTRHNVTLIICHRCAKCFWREIWSTAGEITLPDCLFAPEIFLALCTSACQASEFPFSGRTYTNPESCSPNYRLLFFHSPDDSTLQHAETLSYWQHDQLWERSSSHIYPLTTIKLFQCCLLWVVNGELENISNPIFSSKMQVLNQPLLYFKPSQWLFSCFEFDMAGLLNFYSYLFLSACAWTWWNIKEHTECWILTLLC